MNSNYSVVSRIKILILFIFLVNINLSGAVIQGNVTFADGEKSYEIVNVIIKGSKLGCVANRDGTYKINNIPAGKIIIIYAAISYVSQVDTIYISDSSQVVIHNAELQIPFVVSNSYVENYQNMIIEENKKNPVLSITLDCYSFRDGYVTVHANMRNNSLIDFSVLRIYQCINYVSAIVKDSSGNIIRPIRFAIDCMGEKEIPTRDDEIDIPAWQSVDYPPIKLTGYDFKKLPPGKYTIAIRYKFIRPERLPGTYGYDKDYKKRYEQEIHTLITTLRGEYVSENVLTVLNK